MENQNKRVPKIINVFMERRDKKEQAQSQQ